MSKQYMGPKDLGIDLLDNNEQEVFKWFVASILFAKRIQQKVAARAFKVLEENDFTSPKKFLDAGWQKLVDLLDQGHYVRYDFSTASTFLDVMSKLLADYGTMANLLRISGNKDNLRKNIMEFRGLGPKTAEIFIRSLNWPHVITGQVIDDHYEDNLLEKHHLLDDEESDIFYAYVKKHLPCDYDTPATPAKDIYVYMPKITSTHPEMDTNIDKTELYDEGLTGACGVDDQEEGHVIYKNK